MASLRRDTADRRPGSPSLLVGSPPKRDIVSSASRASPGCPGLFFFPKNPLNP